MGARKRRREVPARERSGRISRTEQVAPAEQSPAVIKRLRDAALAAVRHPEWANGLGLLFIEGRISAPQYEAGKRWNSARAEYIRAIACPSPEPPALSFEIRGKSSAIDPDSEEGLRVAATDRRAVEIMDEMHGVLLRAGKLSEVVVRALCERDVRPVGTQEMEALDRGLGWLAQYYGLLDNSRRS